MKRVLLLPLGMFVIMSSLSSCQSGGNAPYPPDATAGVPPQAAQPTEIHYYHHYYDGDSSWGKNAAVGGGGSSQGGGPEGFQAVTPPASYSR